jgi:hypothetical protein
MRRRTEILPLATIGAALASLSACATPRMHTQDELNSAGLACGLTYGELIQDEEEKKLLIMFRSAPTPEKRQCVYQWARRNHLKLVVIDGISFPETTQ